MQRFAVAIVSLLGLAWFGVPVASSNDKPAPVKIDYHGQSFFTITTSKGKRISFDPHSIPDYYPDGFPKKKADIVCVSHDHPDHSRVQMFDKTEGQKIFYGLQQKKMKRPDWSIIDETVGDVKIKTVGVYHDTEEGLQRGKNTIFIIEVDGWRIGHLGDLGHLFTPPQLKKIGKLDVVLIPVGGIYTINGAEAKKVIEQLKPKEYIFPMHFGTEVFKDILPIDEFLDGQEKRNVVRMSDSVPEAERDNTITLSRAAERPRPLIVQLHYWPKEEKKKN